MTICSPLEGHDESEPLADAYYISFRSSQLVLDKVFAEPLLLQGTNGAPVGLRTPPLSNVVVFGDVSRSYSARRRFELEAEEVSRQPGKVANPARGKLNRENEYFLV